MKQAKDNKGVTLVALIITITIMLIIAVVAIDVGSKDSENAKNQQAIAELQMVKSAVYERYVNYSKTKNQSLLVGEQITDTEVEAIASEMGITLVQIPNSYNEAEKAYYRITPDDLEKMGISNSEENYIVNYITGEIINETIKITTSGVILYTYSRENFNNTDVTAF